MLLWQIWLPQGKSFTFRKELHSFMCKIIILAVCYGLSSSSYSWLFFCSKLLLLSISCLAKRDNKLDKVFNLGTWILFLFTALLSCLVELQELQFWLILVLNISGYTILWIIKNMFLLVRCKTVSYDLKTVCIKTCSSLQYLQK